MLIHTRVLYHGFVIWYEPNIIWDNIGHGVRSTMWGMFFVVVLRLVVSNYIRHSKIDPGTWFEDNHLMFQGQLQIWKLARICWNISGLLGTYNLVDWTRHLWFHSSLWFHLWCQHTVPHPSGPFSPSARPSNRWVCWAVPHLSTHINPQTDRKSMNKS